MIFELFTALAAQLVAVIAAAGFLVWTQGRECGCKRSSKAIGYAVLVFAFGILVCTLFHAWRYAQAGAFQPPRKGPNVQMQVDGMNVGPTMNPAIMNPMMQQQLRQRMQQGAQQKPPTAPPEVDWKDRPVPPQTPPPPPVRVPEDVVPPPVVGE